MHVYVEIDVLGRYICVYERVFMDLDHMAWYLSFPQCVLQTLVVSMRVCSLFKITSGRSTGSGLVDPGGKEVEAFPRGFGFGFCPAGLGLPPSQRLPAPRRRRSVVLTGNARKIAALGRGAGGVPTDPANEGRNRVPAAPLARPARLPRA